MLIRPWRLDEAPRVLDILSRVEVVRWLGDGEPDLLADLDAAHAKIESWHAIEAPRGVWAVEVRETGVPAGSVMLVGIPDSDGLVQIGWNLHPDSHATATPPKRRARSSTTAWPWGSARSER
nr:GNAT family N-acetyltransferase [Nocardioides lijunqiniae]